MMPFTILLGAIFLVTTSTQVVPGSATPEAPPPGICHARPRTYEEMRPTRPPYEPPESTTPTPGPTPSPAPASPEIVGGITTKVREFVACLNTGEILRVYGLYSDATLWSIVNDPRQELLTREAYDELATPKPPAPNDRAKILDIPEVLVLSDGRVRALVRLESRFDSRPRTLALTFIDEDGKWMIDSVSGPLGAFLPERT